MEYLIHPNNHLVPGGLFDYLLCFQFFEYSKIEVLYQLFCNEEQQKTILPFCFPEEGDEQHTDTKVFSFTLTSLDGKRKVGYCKRSTAQKPFQCLVLVTGHAYFALYNDIMESLWAEFVSDYLTFVLICDDLYQRDFPLPGESVVASKSLKVSNPYKFTRSPTTTVYAVGSIKLMERMGVSTVLFLVGQILLERKFVFVGDELSNISNTIRCFMELVQPFVWQHVYIPILPKKMTSYGDAPMPFIIGCQRKIYPLLQEDSDLEDVYVIDVEGGFFLNRPNYPDLFCSQRCVKLASALTRLINSSAVKNEQLDGVVYNQLFLLYRDMFLNYDKFFNTHKTKQFNWKAFIKQSEISYVEFLEEFQNAQMCFMFLDEREQALNEGKRLCDFCPFLMESFENKKELECTTLESLGIVPSEETVCVKCGLKVNPGQPCSTLSGEVLCHTTCHRCVTCLTLIEGNPPLPQEQCVFCFRTAAPLTQRTPKDYQCFHDKTKPSTLGPLTQKTKPKIPKPTKNKILKFFKKDGDQNGDDMYISEPVPDLKMFTKYLGMPDVEMITQRTNPLPYEYQHRDNADKDEEKSGEKKGVKATENTDIKEKAISIPIKEEEVEQQKTLATLVLSPSEVQITGFTPSKANPPKTVRPPPKLASKKHSIEVPSYIPPSFNTPQNSKTQEDTLPPKSEIIESDPVSPLKSPKISQLADSTNATDTKQEQKKSFFKPANPKNAGQRQVAFQIPQKAQTAPVDEHNKFLNTPERSLRAQQHSQSTLTLKSDQTKIPPERKTYMSAQLPQTTRVANMKAFSARPVGAPRQPVSQTTNSISPEAKQNPTYQLTSSQKPSFEGQLKQSQLPSTCSLPVNTARVLSQSLNNPVVPPKPKQIHSRTQALGSNTSRLSRSLNFATSMKSQSSKSVESTQPVGSYSQKQNEQISQPSLTTLPPPPYVMETKTNIEIQQPKSPKTPPLTLRTTSVKSHYSLPDSNDTHVAQPHQVKKPPFVLKSRKVPTKGGESIKDEQPHFGQHKVMEQNTIKNGVPRLQTSTDQA
ncbi:suppression of tumorigenicity, putative [Entamoeba invadens IP1]|uniref:Suppression of tumorigenicity, putative n=1 Tax=Entamoeba invadens IP1 TaxID=370355 RepID=A0A0A1U5X5_ENTIV|nr:suppression of tumorigenicity, putative [Entamoeba invadens IP1]ELP88275.1 suppression of tumorigenicity, putative [Entamoeba invadens IP1]|eukprot:XP_004255046.1 suppression of tumorigenicity, putative [Entamoeba invadens IP1]